MKKLVTELEKGDHVAGYHPTMSVDHTYLYAHFLDNGHDLVIVFNTGMRAFYDSTDMVEVENSAKGDK